MVAPLYISEISPPEIRGTLLVLQELSIVTGIVIAFYLTYGTRYMHGNWAWRLPFLIQMTPAIILAVGVPFLPYTPRWLCQNDRDDEALKTLVKLRQVPEDDPRVQQEWYEIRSEVAYRREIQTERYPRLQDGSTRSRILLQANNWADCWRRGGWRRTQVGVGLMFFQQVRLVICCRPNFSTDRRLVRRDQCADLLLAYALRNHGSRLRDAAHDVRCTQCMPGRRMHLESLGNGQIRTPETALGRRRMHVRITLHYRDPCRSLQWKMARTFRSSLDFGGLPPLLHADIRRNLVS